MSDRKFPVLAANKYPGSPDYVQWDKLDEQWARRLHAQSLDRLAERGGLSPLEIYWNINRCKLCTKVPDDEVIKLVQSISYCLDIPRFLRRETPDRSKA